MPERRGQVISTMGTSCAPRTPILNELFSAQWKSIASPQVPAVKTWIECFKGTVQQYMRILLMEARWGSLLFNLMTIRCVLSENQLCKDIGRCKRTSLYPSSMCSLHFFGLTNHWKVRLSRSVVHGCGLWHTVMILPGLVQACCPNLWCFAVDFKGY